MHAPLDKPLAKVTHDQLYDACKAVQEYFTAVAALAPKVFEPQIMLLKKHPFVDPQNRPKIEYT